MENNIETAKTFFDEWELGERKFVLTKTGFANIMVEYAKKFEIELPNEEEIEKTAKKYAIEHSNAPDKYTPDWIMADFKAGVKFILNIIKEQPK